MSPIDWDKINMSMPTNLDRAFMGPKKVINRKRLTKKLTDRNTTTWKPINRIRNSGIFWRKVINTKTGRHRNWSTRGRVFLSQLSSQFDFTSQWTKCFQWSSTLTSLCWSAHPSIHTINITMQYIQFLIIQQFAFQNNRNMKQRMGSLAKVHKNVMS